MNPRKAENDNFNLLDQSEQCPVCERHPVPTIEPGFKEDLVFLRCPNGHPYVACGYDLLPAINHWNRHVQFRVQHDSRRKMQLPFSKEACFCPTCQHNTGSLIQFERVEPHDWKAGYIVILKQCSECHLVKSQREVA